MWLGNASITTQLKADSRTVLIPKGSNNLKACSDWRPITISSMILRLYSKLLVLRVSSAVTIHGRLTGFVPEIRTA